MATTQRRAAFLLRAHACFQAQVFPADWKVDLIIDQHPTDTLGAKLNKMLEQTTADYLIVWDDDDWYSPNRIQRQIEPLINGCDVSGTSKIYYHKIDTDECWLYSGSGAWLGAIAFTWSAWEQNNFEDITSGTDTRWQNKVQGKKCDLADPALLIASVHIDNACRKHTSGPTWKPVPIERLGDFPRL